MLPQLPSDSGVPSHTIYINPNFAKSQISAPTTTHVNPNFLLSRSSAAIHLNPNFLQRKILEQQQKVFEQQYLQSQMCGMQPVLHAPTNPIAGVEIKLASDPIETPSCRIISKSHMRIVRTPMQTQNTTSKQLSSSPLNPMIKLGRRTLLRKNLLRTTISTTDLKSVSVKKTESYVGPKEKYKIDRTKLQPSAATIRRREFVARYALRRSNIFCTVKRPNLSTLKVSTFRILRSPPNKKLQMLNINGLLYKSTRNKLQRKDTTHSIQLSATEKPTFKSTKYGNTRTVIVSGTRFVLDKQGYKLTRVSDTAATTQSDRQNTRRRIDIGGLTYVATSRNVFVRNGNHLARSHLCIAKQRSVQMLTRNLVKSNVPCAIYQRVGKCSASDRGKCSKLHDRRQVAICSKFLRGECENKLCLLSHDVCLAKMPVCKFFLQGICVRSDCPYLHKKVSRNTEICTDFLRGFCSLAEQCNKRHEFLCPDYERSGKCDRINCAYCKKKRQVHKVTVAATQPNFQDIPKDELEQTNENVEEAGTASMRYFFTGCNGDKGEEVSRSVIEEDESNPCTSIKPTRPKLGILPAYIPFS